MNAGPPGRSAVSSVAKPRNTADGNVEHPEADSGEDGLHHRGAEQAEDHRAHDPADVVDERRVLARQEQRRPAGARALPMRSPSMYSANSTTIVIMNSNRLRAMPPVSETALRETSLP